ncbi:MAG: hypothetical protein L0Z53_10220 [Acidobacteriales bacterium]|nr:hypothetical protein [Terriglobales bacterium]
MASDPEQAPPQDPPKPSAGMNWPKATLWMVVTFIIALNGVIVLKSCLSAPGKVIDKTGTLVDKVSSNLATVAAAFNRGTITTSFVSTATTLSNQQYLQFATLKQTEIFTHTEEKSTAFGYVPLPDVVMEARAPVEYTYYVDMKARWELEMKDRMIHVFAPPIRANKPAVDASAISYEVKKGYLKTAEALENLKRSVTSLVTLRAKDNVPLVRETGRREISEFVETWLARSFTDGSNYHVKVYFPGEKGPGGVLVERPKLE